MGLSHLAIASKIVGKSSVALCDTKFSNRFLFSRLGYRTFASLEKAVVGTPKIDAMVVATPTPSHYPIAKFAFEHAIPCFVEKPLTLDLERSRALAEIAAKSGVTAQMGFVLRYLPNFAKLKAVLESGRYGAVRHYGARMSGNVVTKPDDTWRTNFAMGGGCLNEYGPHLIDLCNFIFGPVADVGRVAIEKVYSTRGDDRLSLDWTHASGVAGEMALDWCDDTKRKSVIQIEVTCETARLYIDNSYFKVERLGAGDDGPEPSPLADEGLPNVTYYLRGEEFTLQLEDFFGRVFGRNLGMKPFAPDQASTLADGVEVDRLIDVIARKGGLK